MKTTESDSRRMPAFLPAVLSTLAHGGTGLALFFMVYSSSNDKFGIRKLFMGVGATLILISALAFNLALWGILSRRPWACKIAAVIFGLFTLLDLLALLTPALFMGLFLIPSALAVWRLWRYKSPSM